MVDLEQLAHRARVASEWGRARMAARIAVPIAALVAIPAALGPVGGRFAALVSLLLVTAVFLRWRGRLGIEVVRVGLAIGVASVTTMLAIHAAAVAHRATDAVPPSSMASVLAVALAGLVVARWASSGARGSGRIAHGLLTPLVAFLTASVGTVGFGVGNLVAVLAFVAMCSAVAYVPAIRFVP